MDDEGCQDCETHEKLRTEEAGGGGGGKGCGGGGGEW